LFLLQFKGYLVFKEMVFKGRLVFKGLQPLVGKSVETVAGMVAGTMAVRVVVLIVLGVLSLEQFKKGCLEIRFFLPVYLGQE
jgi:hypothetical protein